MNEQDEVWVFDPTASRDYSYDQEVAPPLKIGTTIGIGWAPAISRTPRSSQASEDSTLGLSEPDGAPSASQRSTPTPAPSSRSDGPESRTSVTSPGSLSGYQADQVHHTHSTAGSLAASSGTGWQQKVLVPPSGPAASPAKTSASPESDEAWAPTGTAPAPASPTPSLTLWSATDLPPSSSRTYRASSPVMEARTLGRSSVAWASSGTGGPTGFSTLSSSECPSDDDGCSYAPSTLAQVLEPTAPQRFYLSARAATGILRRATRRGRMLPDALSSALTSLAHSMAPLGTTESPTQPSQPASDTTGWTTDLPSSGELDTATTNPDSATSPPATTRTSPTSSSVRRLTPVECERLMGWPDGWTIVREWPRASKHGTGRDTEPKTITELEPSSSEEVA